MYTKIINFFNKKYCHLVIFIKKKHFTAIEEDNIIRVKRNVFEPQTYLTTTQETLYVQMVD